MLWLFFFILRLFAIHRDWSWFSNDPSEICANKKHAILSFQLSACKFSKTLPGYQGPSAFCMADSRPCQRWIRLKLEPSFFMAVGQIGMCNRCNGLMWDSLNAICTIPKSSPCLSVGFWISKPSTNCRFMAMGCSHYPDKHQQKSVSKYKNINTKRLTQYPIYIYIYIHTYVYIYIYIDLNMCI